MTERRVYTKEFKAEAVRLVNEGTESVSEVAKRLGIDVGSLGKWKRAAERDGGVLTPGAKAMVSSATTPSALEAELRRLRAENERLKMERDLLKKATAFFAKESK